MKPRRSKLTPFSPNDAELRDVGNDVGEEMSDSEDTLTLEIRQSSSQQQNKEPGHTAGSQVHLFPDPEQQRVSSLRRQPTCWQPRPRGAPRGNAFAKVCPLRCPVERKAGIERRRKQLGPPTQLACARGCGGTGRGGAGAGLGLDPWWGGRVPGLENGGRSRGLAGSFLVLPGLLCLLPTKDPSVTGP